MNEGDITITGNLTRDPQLRFAQNGNAWVTFPVAVNRRRVDRAGQPTDKTLFVECKAFGQQAENIAESTHKGARVMVSGYLEEESWTAQDGTPRKSLVLIAQETAVSLRFASATLTANQRTPGGAPSYGNGAQASAPAPAPAAAPRPTAPAGGDPFAADSGESPF